MLIKYALEVKVFELAMSKEHYRVVDLAGRNEKKVVVNWSF